MKMIRWSERVGRLGGRRGGVKVWGRVDDGRGTHGGSSIGEGEG